MGWGASLYLCLGSPKFYRERAGELKLTARHLGFLHAVPKDWDRSRWQAHVEATKQEPPLPKLEAGSYMVDELFTIGAFRSGAMGGFIALSWQEVDAFARITGRIKEPWEAELLVKMSREYVKGLQIGSEPMGIPPFNGGKLAVVVSGQLGAVLGA